MPHRSDDPPQEDWPEITVLSERTVMARATYTCFWCKREIPSGSEYTRVAYMDEDNKFRFIKTHTASGDCAHETWED